MTKKRWIGLLVVVALLLGIAGTAFAAPLFITQNCFTDVSTSDWFHDYVCRMYDLGVVGGFGDGTYRPYNTVSRAQVAVMLDNLSGYGSAGEVVRADMSGDIEISGKLTVGSDLKGSTLIVTNHGLVQRSLVVDEDLGVGGNTGISGDLTAVGDVSAGGDLEVVGNGVVDGVLYANGGLIVENGLVVWDGIFRQGGDDLYSYNGYLSVGEFLNVGGDIEADGDISATSIVANSNVTATNFTALADINAYDDLGVGDQLVVGGTGYFESDLYTGGNFTVEGETTCGGYIRLPTRSSPPPSADCDNSSEYGRMIVNIDTESLFICMPSGWDSITP